MTSAVSSESIDIPANFEAARVEGLRFDWLMTFLCAVFLGGMYLDGWAHNHGRVDESFFTVWHAFFYSGYLLVGATLLSVILLNRQRGFSITQAIPEGYRLTLVGLFVFAAGGLGDMVWHQLFGIEDGIEALFSPTHLLLGLGMGLVVTGPLRAVWNRVDAAGSWQVLAPGIVSLALLSATITFFLMFSFPVTVLLGAKGNHLLQNDVGKVAGLIGTIISGLTLTGPLLLVLRRWRLPLGAVTLVFGITVLGATIVDFEMINMVWLAAGMMGGGVLVDYLAWRAQPRQNPGSIRWLAPAMPLLLFGGYYAVLLPTVGTLWSVHLWTSTIAMPAIACWLMSYLILPPDLKLAE